MEAGLKLRGGVFVLQEFLWFIFGLAALAAVLASFPGLSDPASSGGSRRGRRKSPIKD